MAENREYQKAIDYLYGLVEENKISIGDKLPTERKMWYGMLPVCLQENSIIPA